MWLLQIRSEVFKNGSVTKLVSRDLSVLVIVVTNLTELGQAYIYARTTEMTHKYINVFNFDFCHFVIERN